MQHPSEKFQKQDSSTISEAPHLRPRTTLKEPAERQGTERICETEYGESVREALTPTKKSWQKDFALSQDFFTFREDHFVQSLYNEKPIYKKITIFAALVSFLWQKRINHPD